MTTENQTPPHVELGFEVTMEELDAFQALGPAGIEVLRQQIRGYALPAACRLQIASLAQQRGRLEEALEELEHQAGTNGYLGVGRESRPGPETESGRLTPAAGNIDLPVPDPDADEVCEHDSLRADGWLDDHCLRCGSAGYWRHGVEDHPPADHPSGALLLAPRAVAPGCEDAGTPPPAPPPPSDPPAAAPEPSPQPDPAPAPRAGRTKVTDEDLERAARVCLEERKATVSSIAIAALRTAGGSSTTASPALLRRVRDYLAAHNDSIEETGHTRGRATYGLRQDLAESPQEPESPWIGPDPGQDQPRRSEPAGGAEDVLVTVQREIRSTLSHGPSRIPAIARQHDRPPAQIAQAMELLKRDGTVEKIPGGEYELVPA